MFDNKIFASIINLLNILIKNYFSVQQNNLYAQHCAPMHTLVNWFKFLRYSKTFISAFMSSFFLC